VDSVTSLLILTFILCLSVTAVYFYGFLNAKNENFNSVAQKNLAPALSFLALALYFYQVFIHVFNLQLNGKIQLSAGVAVALIGLIYLIVSVFYQAFSKQRANSRLWVINGMLALLAGISSIGFYYSQTPYDLDQSGWALYLHLFLSLASYAMLSLALIFALLHLWRSRQLNNLELNDHSLPNLEFLETEGFRWLCLGFILLTVALLTGFFFLYDLRAQHLPHKVILSVISWTIFAILLTGKFWLGWRGKQAFKWVLGGFIFLALAYFGSKIILEVFLNRSWQ